MHIFTLTFSDILTPILGMVVSCVRFSLLIGPICTFHCGLNAVNCIFSDFELNGINTAHCVPSRAELGRKIVKQQALGNLECRDAFVLPNAEGALEPDLSFSSKTLSQNNC